MAPKLLQSNARSQPRGSLRLPPDGKTLHGRGVHSMQQPQSSQSVQTHCFRRGRGFVGRRVAAHPCQLMAHAKPYIAHTA